MPKFLTENGGHVFNGERLVHNFYNDYLCKPLLAHAGHHPYNYPGPLPGGYYAPEQPPYPYCHPPPPQDVNAGLPNAFVDYRYVYMYNAWYYCPTQLFCILS